jgi:hypothetical protein
VVAGFTRESEALPGHGDEDADGIGDGDGDGDGDGGLDRGG